jgi:glycogen operon protein
MNQDTQPGGSYPIGATVTPGGVGFSIYSRDSTAMELLFFDDVDAQAPSQVIELHPKFNRTFPYWHVFVPGIQPGQLYGYRAYGSHRPDQGLRYDHEKVLLDPYGLSVAIGNSYDRDAAARPGDNVARCLKSVVIDPGHYDWEGDTPLNRPFSQTVIYEMHVGGFTRHPSSKVAAERRGTYAGLTEKIPYLQDLGITAVELLPVFQFDEQDCPPGRVNYWGYSPISFFAPHATYSSRKDPLGTIDEFRDMVKALHRSGIEVILDVVYNHTAEGDQNGPNFCYRGLANDTYYILKGDKANYANYSGCGNTFNANNAIVKRMILDSLRYWVQVMHVDGFRFDLASILSRDEHGHPLANPPVVWEIDTDPVLAGTKVIAEAWDAAGLYQVGSFVGDRWKEWNGRFRDDVREFWKSEPKSVSKLASRMLASPDIYGHEPREAEQSINFVTCHDGFTLNDLVSYNDKHNEANGEHNRDGDSHNRSWNCGAEGPTNDPLIEQLRNRQIKNFLATNLLALGTPMIWMGDEVRRTQKGNNNAYCQDNEISWFDWHLLRRHRDIHRFAKRLIHFRLNMEVNEDHNLSLVEMLGHAKIQWHGIKLHQPDWGDGSHSVAVSSKSLDWTRMLHIILNSYWEPLTFELPPVSGGPGRGWRRVIDTALESPSDICGWQEAPLVDGKTYLVQPRSLVLLETGISD